MKAAATLIRRASTASPFAGIHYRVDKSSSGISQKRLVLLRSPAVPRPVKGIVSRNVLNDRALLELEDGANVYLEEIDSPKSKRRPEELRRFDGKRV